MFTGIIEETGIVKNVEIRGESGSVQIGAKKVLEGTKVGDSIAVNGDYGQTKRWLFRRQNVWKVIRLSFRVDIHGINSV